MRRIIPTAVLALVVACTPGDAVLNPAFDVVVTGPYCEVSAEGPAPTGDIVVLQARGPESGPAEGIFRAVTPAGGDRFIGTATSLICTVNGSTIARIHGTGKLNNVTGYTFDALAQIHDSSKEFAMRVVDAAGSTVYTFEVFFEGRLVIDVTLPTP